MAPQQIFIGIFLLFGAALVIGTVSWVGIMELRSPTDHSAIPASWNSSPSPPVLLVVILGIAVGLMIGILGTNTLGWTDLGNFTLVPHR